MNGLVHRRNAEIAWFHTPDDVETPPAPNPDIVHSPKAERNPPPKGVTDSKTVVAGGSVFLATIAHIAQKVSETLDPIIQAKGSLDGLGVLGGLGVLMHNPAILMGVAVAGLAVFIIMDRRHKLLVDNV
jgi:hypothetical protein